MSHSWHRRGFSRQQIVLRETREENGVGTEAQATRRRETVVPRYSSTGLPPSYSSIFKIEDEDKRNDDVAFATGHM